MPPTGSAIGAVTLNGTTQYGQSSSNSNLAFVGGDDFTVSFSFKTTAATNPASVQCLLCYHTGTVGWRFTLSTSGLVVFALTDDAAASITLTSASACADASWHEVEAVVDRDSAQALLFVDGTLEAKTSITVGALTTTTLTVGANETPAQYFAGSISEIRISNNARHGDDYSVAVVEYVDDGYTKALYHFNEGNGSTVYDMSTSRIDVTLYNSVSWAAGAYLSSPVNVVLDHLWMVLDTDDDFSSYCSASDVKRWRFRPGDKTPTTLLGPEETPALFVWPGSVPPPRLETSAFHSFKIPVRIEGALYAQSIYDIGLFWFLTVQALHNATSIDGGHLGCSNVENFTERGPMFPNVERRRGRLFLSFVDTFDVEYRRPLR